MAEIRWTHQAADDLLAIAEFIARDSSNYARLFAVDVVRAVERLAKFPQSGRVVPELKVAYIREILFGNYRIVYRLHGSAAQILTIYHGAKLLDVSKLK